jgi:hypothetical protein
MNPALKPQKKPEQRIPIEIEEDHDSMRWLMLPQAFAVL